MTTLTNTIKTIFNYFPLVYLPADPIERCTEPTLYFGPDPTSLTIHNLCKRRNLNIKYVPSEMLFMVVPRSKTVNVPGTVDEKIDILEGQKIYPYIDQSRKTEISDEERAYTHIITSDFGDCIILADYIDSKPWSQPPETKLIFEKVKDWSEAFHNFEESCALLAKQEGRFSDVYEATLHGHCSVIFAHDSTHYKLLQKVISRHALFAEK